MKEKIGIEKEQLREQIETEIRDSHTTRMKDTMEQLFGLLSARIKSKDLYEGDELLSMLKGAVKTVIKAQQ